MMASRASGRTSTVLSKTTSKIILKKSQAVVTLSSEEKAEALAKKTEAIEEARRKRAAWATSDPTPKLAPTQPISFASTLDSQAKERVANFSNNKGPMETQESPPNLMVWPVPASNTEYQRLPRPQTSICGVSAVGRLQISGRSALGLISNNVPPQVAQSQGTIVANGDRPTDKIYSPRDFQVGAVFSAATHQRDYAETLDLRNPNQSMTHLGVVHSKFRKFVILARFATHVLALPIYTHDGRGLANKPHKNEFVSIRDVDQGQQATMPESKHDVIWAERYPGFKNSNITSWFMMSNATSIHLTAPYSHPMGLKCTISGKLKAGSIDYLLKLFGEVTASTVSIDSSTAKLTTDADGFTTIRVATSRVGAPASILRGRESYRPSSLANSYQPQR
ncbi:hypothetical protein N431DRAFT_530390 [Stipitochalara longipes BDJ]|nr:hypothetical protein N431DRAFT_530390 [Stipitochalara longipes BDJ]